MAYERKYNFKQLLDIIEPYIEDGSINVKWGEYEGEDFLIVDSWEDVAFINGLINGFVGLRNHFGPYNGETLADERDKIKAELEIELKKNPTHYGTHRRLENKLKDIDSNILYRQYLHANQIEEKDIGDYVDHGFSDEYDTCCGGCNGCNNIVRTSPDSYSWTPPLFVDCEGYACEECVEKGYYDDYLLEEYKNETKSIPDSFDLDRLGLVQVNEESFENGWYGGQLDEPQPIIDAFNDQGIDVWFKVYPRQFDLDFDVYVKSDDLEKAKVILSNTDTEAEEDPAVVLERGLKAASSAMSGLQGEGVKYAKINSDGTADVRLVGKEEFIEGIKN